MVDQNLTFDDGEPLDISKLQKLYGIILDVQAQANAATSTYNQTIKQIPKTYSGTTGEVSVSNKVQKVANIDLSAANFQSRPRIMITPRGTDTNITYITFSISNVTTSGADLNAVVTKTGVSSVRAVFDFVAVSMEAISS